MTIAQIKPILFKGDMVRAILDGRKTQTRRIVKDVENTIGRFLDGQIVFDRNKCPYGNPGDLLYVRETWRWYGTKWTTEDRENIELHVGYHADNTESRITVPCKSVEYPKYKGCDCDDKVLCDCLDKWWKRQHKKPSIFMPKWATRIWLKVKSVRVERVQDIDELDALAEGVECEKMVHGKLNGVEGDFAHGMARDGFRNLWDEINKKRGYGWDENPFVWKITFERTEP